jgi:hypothetical protein
VIPAQAPNNIRTRNWPTVYLKAFEVTPCSEQAALTKVSPTLNEISGIDDFVSNLSLKLNTATV